MSHLTCWYVSSGGDIYSLKSVDDMEDIGETAKRFGGDGRKAFPLIVKFVAVKVEPEDEESVGAAF